MNREMRGRRQQKGNRAGKRGKQRHTCYREPTRVKKCSVEENETQRCMVVVCRQREVCVVVCEEEKAARQRETVGR